MTLVQFSHLYAVLAAQLRTEINVVEVKAYYRVMSDLETELVALAADRLATGHALDEQGRAWFPKAPEWRALTLAIDRERTDELKARLRKRLTPLCLACDDTGWDRTQDDRVVPCDCRKMRRLEVLGRRPMPTVPELEA